MGEHQGFGDHRDYYGGGWHRVTIGGLRGNARAARGQGDHVFANYLDRLADIKESVPRIVQVRVRGFEPVRFKPVSRSTATPARSRRP